MRAHLTILVGMLALHGCGDDSSRREADSSADNRATPADGPAQQIDPARLIASCAGITKNDAAAVLGVAPQTLSDRSRDETPRLRLCSYAQSAAPHATAAFNLSARESAERASRSMASEREAMGTAASSISSAVGTDGSGSATDDLQGIGDEAFWSPLNGALMMRVHRVIVQITQPEDRDRQRDLARRIAAKLRGDDTVPGPQAGGASAESIPLVDGLTVVTAIHIDGVCDCESVKQVTVADRESLHVSYAADIPAPAIDDLFGTQAKKRDIRQVRGERTVLRTDLQHARHYMHRFGEGIPQHIPGSTALGVSAAVLNDLNERGSAQLSMPESGLGTGLAGLIGQFGGKDFAGVKEIDELAELDKVVGTLQRVDAAPVTFRTLVNGEMRALPAVHASGRLGDLDGDFYILDDPANPLALQWSLGEDRLQVVKIEYPRSAANNTQSWLTCALGGDDRRAEIYGIHFDFASAAIRPQSRQVLQEIAAALRSQPQWSLRIEGHTDRVGADDYNAELSRARAAAIRQSLIDEHEIAASRLATVGFGESRPKVSNDTLEGRARNRRVELVRTDATTDRSRCA